MAQLNKFRKGIKVTNNTNQTKNLSGINTTLNVKLIF